MKYLYNHTSEETAYVVEDYPWGFRLKTKIRYWIETSDKKNGGQRFCSQTVNPKTGAWCAVKKGTYSPIAIMYLDENDHVKYLTCNGYNQEEYLNRFKDTHLEMLNEYQKKELRILIAQNKVMNKLTFTCVPVANGGEWEERKKKQEKDMKLINRAIAHEYARVSI